VRKHQNIPHAKRALAYRDPVEARLHFLHDLRGKLATAKRYSAAPALQRCMAAIEFAMIVPMMVVMFIGAVELSQAIIVDRRVTQIASTTADLVARADTQISRSDSTDIMKAGSYIMAPYSQPPRRPSSANSSPRPQARPTSSSPGCALITANGTGTTLSCSCTSNTPATAPANLVATW